MPKSKKEKIIVDEQLTIDNEQLINKESDDDSTTQQFSNSTIVLMPELEELVKKNPNRLIGCGG
ncbi:MAG: hypothetical protein U0T69_07345 [Chitinophagales bacterium]|nr:hypothetical protein [Chitinophagales bacterium]